MTHPSLPASQPSGAPASLPPCPCGLAAGRAACQELMDDIALRVRALAWTGSMTTWRLMHDVYSIQHEEEYCGGTPAS